MANPRVTTPADFESLSGQTLGVSDWLEITQERIDRFAEATGDRQWIHTDPQRARRESPFGATIAHGYLTMSLMPMLLAQVVKIDARMLVNPGVERLRLREPVRCGDRIRMHVEVLAVRALPGGGARVRFGVRFEIEGRRRPAALGEVLMACYP